MKAKDEAELQPPRWRGKVKILPKIKNGDYLSPPQIRNEERNISPAEQEVENW